MPPSSRARYRAWSCCWLQALTRVPRTNVRALPPSTLCTCTCRHVRARAHLSLRDVRTCVRSADAQTPLHIAASVGAPTEAVDLLLRSGCDYAVRDERGLTAHHVARSKRHLHLCALLASHAEAKAATTAEPSAAAAAATDAADSSHRAGGTPQSGDGADNDAAPRPRRQRQQQRQRHRRDKFPVEAIAGQCESFAPGSEGLLAGDGSAPSSVGRGAAVAAEPELATPRGGGEQLGHKPRGWRGRGRGHPRGRGGRGYVTGRGGGASRGSVRVGEPPSG